MVDQTVDEKTISRKHNLKAENVIILIWMFTGFLITSGYKSVLLSTLVSIEYERPIDTIYDLLQTEMPIFIDEITMKVWNDSCAQELKTKVSTYEPGAAFPDTIRDG